MAKKIPYEERFDRLQQLSLAAYSTFYVWKTLQIENNNDVYDSNRDFWATVLPALQHEWFIGLARIYENSSHSKSGSVISVYALIPDHPNATRAKEAEDFLDKNKRVLENIGRIRDNIHAHNNAKSLVNTKEFEKRYSIKYFEIEDIFNFTHKLLGILHPQDGHGYMLDHLKEEAERDTKYLVEKLQYFNSLRDVHREKFLRGEVSDIRFPPRQ